MNDYTHKVTKLLLHGGRLRLKDSRNDSYFKELTKNLNDGDKVLFIGFARNDGEDEITQFEKEKNWVLSSTNKKIVFERAQKNSLLDQIKDSASIEITGGNTKKLVDTIKEYPNFIDSLKGKTVGGSSAGAYLFAKHYYDSKTDTIQDGLGVLNMRISAHANNREFGHLDKIKSKLNTINDGSELLLLDECDWTMRTINDTEIS